MSRAVILLSFLFLWISQAAVADSRRSDEAVWSALRSGGYVVLIRHAVTEPGIGDPPGFRHGQCSTQRNLSDEGRADAKRIGEAFRRRKIPISEVLSSRWCRCIDTAMLAFGKARTVTMLDSMFNDTEKPAEEKTQEVFDTVARRPLTGNLILVTHNQNIQALTGVSPASGEMVVVAADQPGKFRLIGRIAVAGN